MPRLMNHQTNRKKGADKCTLMSCDLKPTSLDQSEYLIKHYNSSTIGYEAKQA